MYKFLAESKQESLFDKHKRSVKVETQSYDVIVYMVQYYWIQEAKESFASPDNFFMGHCIMHIVKLLYCGYMATKSPFCLHSILPPECIGSRWNPVMLKPKDLLCPLRYHLSGLIQGIGSYLKTTKGCQARYFKDRQL